MPENRGSHRRRARFRLSFGLIRQSYVQIWPFVGSRHHELEDIRQNTLISSRTRWLELYKKSIYIRVKSSSQRNKAGKNNWHRLNRTALGWRACAWHRLQWKHRENTKKWNLEKVCWYSWIRLKLGVKFIQLRVVGCRIRLEHINRSQNSSKANN
jgi:hypothetical protein